MKYTRNRQHSKYVEPLPKRDESTEITAAEFDALCAAIAELEKTFTAAIHQLGDKVIAELANYSATTRTKL